MVALLPLFPLSSSFRLMQPDDGAQEPDATADAYYYVEAAVGVERHLWDHKNPYYDCRGARLQEEQDQQRAQGSFTQVRAARMRKTLVLLWWVYFREFLSSRTSYGGCAISESRILFQYAMGLLL